MELDFDPPRTPPISMLKERNSVSRLANFCPGKRPSGRTQICKLAFSTLKSGGEGVTLWKNGQRNLLANFCPTPVVFWTCFERKMPRRTPTTEGDGRRTMRVLKSRVFCRCEINARLCASAPPSFDTSTLKSGVHGGHMFLVLLARGRLFCTTRKIMLKNCQIK